MYPLKANSDINELQIHLKNLLAQTKKTIHDQSDLNQKMYFYNFEKVSLKLIKYAIQFMTHLPIPQKIYHSYDDIRFIFDLINTTAKDRKARSSKTYLNEDVFGLFAAKHQPAEIEEKGDKEQEELDLIEQFMIKRNHQIQSNAFGDVDDVFKNRERRGLEEFLHHANNQASNLEKHLKSATNDRKNIIAKHQSADSARPYINRKKHNQLAKIIEDQKFNRFDFGPEPVETVDREIQTIFRNSNVKWSKILTYCMEKTEEDENENENAEGKIDKEIYGDMKKLLFATSTQTGPEETERKPESNQVQIRKISKKKTTTATKGVKKLTYKPSNSKGSNQKTKDMKTTSVYIKEDREEDDNFAMNSYSTKFCGTQKRVQNLMIDLNVLNEFVEPQKRHESPKSEFRTPEEPVSMGRRGEKKLTRVLEQREMIFEFKSKKDVSKERRSEFEESFRSLKKNKTTIGHIRTTERIPDPDSSPTRENNNTLDPNRINPMNRTKDSFYDKKQEKEDSKRRRNQKKPSWRESMIEDASIMKFDDSKHDHSIEVEQKPTIKISMSEAKLNDDKNKGLNKRSSQFKPSTMSNLQKKAKFEKRNTIEEIIVTSQFKHQPQTNVMHLDLNDSKNNNNLIEEEESEGTYRNSGDNLPVEGSLEDRMSKNDKPRNTQKLSHPETIRTEDMMQSLYDKPQMKRASNIAGVLYRQPSTIPITPNTEDSKISKIKFQHNSNINLRIMTEYKDDDDSKIIPANHLQRNSFTVHNSLSKDHKKFGTGQKKRKDKRKDLPYLNGCKQKLSEIKKSLSKEVMKYSAVAKTSDTKPLFRALNMMKNSPLQSAAHKIEQYEHKSEIIQLTKDPREVKIVIRKQKQNNNRLNSEIREQTIESDNKIPSIKEIKKPESRPDLVGQREIIMKTTKKMNQNDETGVIKTIRRLLMTNTYRDKLLMYLSMIEVMHQRCCGKDCEHMTKFMKDITGGSEMAEETVARQLLKMYNTRPMNFKDVSNVWNRFEGN